MKPVLLPPNTIHHFYRGGSRLAALRGFVPDSEFLPEEWLAATVHRAGMPDSGPSRLADGTLFADLVAADPQGWLGTLDGGPAGDADTGVLLKLLDADQRLPVHVHPDRAFARTELHSCYGKTECWYILQTAGDDPAVWLGWNTDVDPDELWTAIDTQDSEWMLARLNKITVSPGDGILVPAGTAHAIGPGVFVVEAQEPTDQSILLEWSVTTDGREDSHLGLGFPTALKALNHRATTPEALAALVQHVEATEPGDHSVLPAAADPFFRIDQLVSADDVLTVEAGFSVLVVVDGEGTISALHEQGSEDAITVHRGEVLAVPAGFGQWSVSGDVRIVRCRPGTSLPQAVVTT